MGCDANILSYERFTKISIHAPTWGATKVVRGHMGSPYISIHAPTWGATGLTLFNLAVIAFQSTHPRGVRPANWSLYRLCVFISIHAPTWGATSASGQSLVVQLISIHAPTWGATMGVSLVKDFNRISIHAPTWGATGGHGLGTGHG